MQLSAAMREVVAQVARRYRIEEAVLCRVIEDESAAELARALRIEPGMAVEHMQRLRRALTVQTDIGAGCKLLTDAVEAEALAALREL